MRAVALMLSIALLGCFPHNPKMRTYSKLTEGGLLVAGIGMEFLANSRTGADCDQMATQGSSNSSCHSTGSILSGVGLGMILAGLTGFIATISTAEEDKPAPPAVDIKVQPEEKPTVKLPAGEPAPAPAAPPAEPAAAPTGSAAPSTPAP